MTTHQAIVDRLRAAGRELPPAMPAVASYVPFVLTETSAGTLVHIAGQGPFRDGRLEYVGRIGADMTIGDAIASARLVTLNVLAQAAAATQAKFGSHSLHKARCVRLGIFLNCVDGFADLEPIADAASALVMDALGNKGRHCRSLVGKPVLPMQTSVEIDAIFLLDPT
jgi:enamine deaminase RidA (YjgF/YER057c/UK114 family)